MMASGSTATAWIVMVAPSWQEEPDVGEMIRTRGSRPPPKPVSLASGPLMTAMPTAAPASGACGEEPPPPPQAGTRNAPMSTRRIRGSTRIAGLLSRLITRSATSGCRYGGSQGKGPGYNASPFSRRSDHAPTPALAGSDDPVAAGPAADGAGVRRARVEAVPLEGQLADDRR